MSFGMWSRKGPATSASVMVYFTSGSPYGVPSASTVSGSSVAPLLRIPLASRNAASARVVRAPMPASISPGEKPARSSATWSASARRAATESSPLPRGGVAARANADKRKVAARIANTRAGQRLASEGVAMQWQPSRSVPVLPEQPEPSCGLQIGDFTAMDHLRGVLRCEPADLDRLVLVLVGLGIAGAGRPQSCGAVERHHFRAEPGRRVERQQPLETTRESIPTPPGIRGARPRPDPRRLPGSPRAAPTGTGLPRAGTASRAAPAHRRPRA